MNTIKFIEDLNETDKSKIRSTIYKSGILSTYNEEDNRMIFYTSKNKKFLNFPNDIAKNIWLECNGLVLDMKSMKPLVIPQKTFIKSIDTNEVNLNLSKDLYDISLIEDGTTISLYYSDNLDSWRISTQKGYDVTDKMWGSQTYKSIIDDILIVYNIEKIDFFDSLNKSKCYTFGFKHPSMHPFREGKPDPIIKMWFIQSTELISPYIVSTEFDNPKIPKQTVYNFPLEKNTKVLFNQLRMSFTNFLSSGDINYGFILRSKDESQTGINSNIILKSSLMNRIRQLYYNAPIDKLDKDKYDIEKYIVISSYLDTNTHNMFITLFPQYESLYKKLNDIKSKLIKSILQYAKFIKHRDGNEYNNQIAIHLYNHIAQHCHIDINYRHINRIISSFINNKIYISLYYKLLTEQTTE
jgi:hypothetical protein